MNVAELRIALSGYPGDMDVQLCAIFRDSADSRLLRVDSDATRVFLRDHRFTIGERDKVVLQGETYVIPFIWEGKVHNV